MWFAWVEGAGGASAGKDQFTMLKRSGLGVAVLAAVGVLAACGPTPMGPSVSDGPGFARPGGPGAPGVVDPNTPLFGGTVTKSASRAYPISGGTLLVTRDGKTAVAADPDRGRVFLANLETKDVRPVVVDEADEVGRVVEGESGTVYVVARRGGALLRIDIATGSVQRFPVCSAPRGAAYDATKKLIHVTCASGSLVTLDHLSGAVVRKLAVADDLRDVVMVKDQLVVTRFRSAEIMTVDAAGIVQSRQVPQSSGPDGRPGTSTLAFRAVAKPNGGVVVVHQSSSSSEVGIELGSYGSGGNCGGSVTGTFMTDIPYVSTGQTGLSLNTTSLGGATGPLDVAISPDGQRTAIIATGNSWSLASSQTSVKTQNSDVIRLQGQRPTLQIIDSTMGSNGSGGCWDRQAKNLDDPGEAVAVAFDANGKYVVQYREPAKLILEDQSQIVHQILLSTDSRADTGLALFYVNASGGISCASCHPEGGVDGHVWKFSNGERVTQPLQGKVSGRAPFHWSGDLGKWNDVIDQVMMKRMAMPLTPTADQSQALLSWLDTIPNAPPVDDQDQAAVGRGRALFESASVGCVSCHAGGIFSDNKIYDVGTGGTFVAPSLIGAGSRAPFMHNGCAPTLLSRFDDTACGGGDLHGKTSQLTSSQKNELVAFLRSL